MNKTLRERMAAVREIHDKRVAIGADKFTPEESEMASLINDLERKLEVAEKMLENFMLMEHLTEDHMYPQYQWLFTVAKQTLTLISLEKGE